MKNNRTMSTYKDNMLKIIEGRRNPIAWIEKNIKIVHPARGIIPFELYQFQKNAINLMISKHFVITLKSRQVGFSTVSQALSLWAALSYANYKILILSTGIRTAVKFLGNIRGMYERMNPEDKWWSIADESINDGKKTKTTNNKTEISFENGSSILALPASSSAARGIAANLLIIDEGGFIDKISSAYTGIFPTLSRAFKGENRFFGIIIISTPNGISGQGEWYYKQYMNAVEKKSKFIPLRVHWSEVDEYDEEWYLEQCEVLGWDARSIASELEMSFLGSGDTYIPSKILESIAISEPIEKIMNDDFWIFEQPIPGRKYVLGVDFAYGTGGDASTIQVIDAVTLNQVAEFISNKIIASKFADVIARVSDMYNGALTNIERNSGGKILIERIIEAYPYMDKRLYRDSNKGGLSLEKPKFGQLIVNKDKDIGTIVTGVSRDVILSNMYTILLERYLLLMPDFSTAEDNEETLKMKFLTARKSGGKEKVGANKVHGIVKSERLLLQLLGFIVDKNGKPQGKKDDAVLAYAHALYAWAKNKPFLLRNAVNMLPVETPQIPQLELERRYNTNMLRSLNHGLTQTQIDEHIFNLDAEDTKSLLQKDADVARVWGAFIN